MATTRAFEAYRAAIGPWARKAERERKVINHVRWDGSTIQVEMAKPQRQASADTEEHRSARGITQGDLL